MDIISIIITFFIAVFILGIVCFYSGNWKKDGFYDSAGNRWDELGNVFDKNDKMIVKDGKIIN